MASFPHSSVYRAEVLNHFKSRAINALRICCGLWIVWDFDSRNELTSFCSTWRAVFSTSRNWVSCLRSSSCTCLIWTQQWKQRFMKVKWQLTKRSVVWASMRLACSASEESLTECKSVASFSMRVWGFPLLWDHLERSYNRRHDASSFPNN